MLSREWDVSRFWDTNPPFNGRRGENGDDGSSDLAADSPELRSSRTGFRPDASNCGQTILVRNRTRSVAKKKELFEPGRVQLRRSETSSKQGAQLRRKKDLFETRCVQLKRSETCSKQEASSCEEKGLVPNRARAVMKKRTSFETGLVQL